MWDQAITDSYGYLFTAECGTCQGIECSSEGEDAQNQSVPKVVLKKSTEFCAPCFGEQGLIQAPSLLPLLPGSNTAHLILHQVYTLLLGPQAVDLNTVKQ